MAQVQRFVEEVDEGEAPEAYWRLRDDNGEIISQGEGYADPDNVQEGVNNVAKEFTQLVLEGWAAKYGKSTPTNFGELLQLVKEPGAVKVEVVDV